MVVSEMEPFAKTGGLADVAGALPKALGSLGLDMHVFLPRYLCVKETRGCVEAGKGVTVHFIDHPGFFHRPALYGDSNGDYPDNLDRFSFFCREVFVQMNSLGIRPDLLHAHDWQSALSIVYLANRFREDPHFSRTASLFTIHNLAYQGLFPKDQFPRLDLPWSLFAIHGLEYYDRINLLKGGLVFARALTTVSPTYAREIQTREQGEGLEGVLQMRSRDLNGVLNGIDQEAWNPAADRLIPAPFDFKRLDPKEKNKGALQKEMGLPMDPEAFLIGMVTRLASQKGLDLVVEAIPRLASLGIQLVILGSGDRAIEEALSRSAESSKMIRLRLAFDNALAHRIYAGSDAFLMPSRYEPCGLGQMIAMRYGTIPIVRKTGGLNDTVQEEHPVEERGNGFCFELASPEAIVEAVTRALALYRNPPKWKKLQRQVMGADFSWDRSAREYLRLYEKLVG